MSNIQHIERGRYGFTLVELLIVIVVIAILAATSVAVYAGIQQRARDSQRKSDISQLTKALELYYTDNGRFPAGSGSTIINGNWSTTADESWPALMTALAPYGRMPSKDPINNEGVSVTEAGSNRYSYAYFSNRTANSYCGASTPGQMYILVYRLESSSQDRVLSGDCPSNALGPYSASSNYRVVK